MYDANDPTHVLIRSACHSNYQGMTALVGTDNLVYLGKAENYHSQDTPP